MIIIINGPLGIGKSSLAEAVSERIEQCVHLDGDGLIAVNPPPDDEQALLHKAIAHLVPHYLGQGFRHFVINHFWDSPEALEDLQGRLKGIDPAILVRAFLLTLPLEQNLARIQRRQQARAIDESDFEMATVTAERQTLISWRNNEVGEHFDASGQVDELARAMIATLQDDLSAE